MPEPKRIQRKRTRGWRMPEGACYVGRGTVYGNPFVVGEPAPAWAARRYGVDRIETAEQAVALFRRALINEMQPDTPAADATADLIAALHGKDLACFCPLVDKYGNYAHCHADVLLSLANDIPMDEVIRENTRRAKGEAMR